MGVTAAVAAVASVVVSGYSVAKNQEMQGQARKQQETAMENQRAAQATQQAQAEQAMQQQQKQASDAMAAQQLQTDQQMQATQSQFDKQMQMQQAQLKTAEESVNKGSAKRPNSTAMLAATEQAAKAGSSGTMLTGPQGVDPSALSLSKNTLLGS